MWCIFLNVFLFLIFTLAQIVYKAITSVIFAVCFCDMLLQRFSSLYKISAEMSLCLEKNDKGTLSFSQIWNVLSWTDWRSRSISSRNAEYFASVFVCVCARKYHSLSSKNIMSCFLCVFSLSRARSRSQLHSQSSNVTGFSLFFYLKATYTECYVFCIIINMS